MDCPRDQSPLKTRRYEADVQVDECPSCLGIWLDATELERIQETLERDYSQELGQVETVARAYDIARQKHRPDIACPRCSLPLVPREYGYCSQVLSDSCTRCRGVWLDQGELAALELFFEGARANATASQVRKAFWGSLLLGPS